MRITEKGFVAVNILTNPPHMMVWSVARRANQVRKNILDNWSRKDGQPPTWNDVKRDGVRIRKVKLEIL